jgi:hypothetical protein
VLVVFAKLTNHLLGTHSFLIIVLEPLISRDVADGTNCGSADFACPLCYGVRYRQDFRGLLIEEQVIIAKVPPLMCQ